MDNRNKLVKSYSNYFVHFYRSLTWRPNADINGFFMEYNQQTGTIDRKSDLGYYTEFNYEGSKPHAVTSLVNNYDATSSFPTKQLAATYTDFKKLKTLSEGNRGYEITYGVDDQRKRTVYSESGSNMFTRYYLGDYEIERNSAGRERKIHYLSGGDGLAAIYVRWDDGRDSLLYAYTDNLGSIIALTDVNHNVVERYAYDPWGACRNPTNWTQRDSRTSWVTNRGYTGHEHLDQFGVINMNGRVYDPLTAMFLSPDPFVQAPNNWLNYNRYGYCYNNPLKYTDPSGEFIFSLFLGPVGVILDAACWGAVIGAGSSAVAYGIGAAITGQGSAQGFWKAVGMGAAGGAIGGAFSAIGAVGALGSFGNTLGYNILSQGSSSALTSAMFGQDVSISSLAGIVAGGLFSAAFLPNFSAVSGGAFKNAVAEIGFNAGKGALSGTVSGFAQAHIDDDVSAIWRGTLGGAVSGASTSLMTIGAYGAAVQFDDSFLGFPKGSGPVYRTGGLSSVVGDGGINWGRSAWANGRKYNGMELNKTLIHEGTHWQQQQQDGFASFYGRTVVNYVKTYIKFGTLYRLYHDVNYMPDNYDFKATKIEGRYESKFK